jgi:Uma2 family endonuclease
MQSAPTPASAATVPAATERPRPSLKDADQRVILYGMTWKDYEILLAVRGDRAGVRLYYLNGAIELMSPTRSHEGIKTTLARLLYAYCEERSIELSGYGSWTLRNAPEERGAEPDECYMVGGIDKEVPDLAIEVIWSHDGGLDKLEIYKGLGVSEVWVWDRDTGLRVFALGDQGYAPVKASRFFPGLDLVWFASFLDQPTQSQAVRALRAALRAAE